MAKLPYFPFYPGDWLKDPELRVCSHFARGLLVDLLCAAFEAKHRGRLAMPDGVTPWTDEQVVALSAGGSTEQKLAALKELEANHVLKRDSNGVLYSSRMVRDEEIREKRASAGSKGGSKTQANHQANGQAKCKQNPEYAIAYEYDSPSGNLSGGYGGPTPVGWDSDEYAEAVSLWREFRFKRDGSYPPDMQIEQITLQKASAGWSSEKFLRSVRASIAWGAKTVRDADLDYEKQRETAKPKQTKPRLLTEEEIERYNATGELPEGALDPIHG